MQTSVEEMYYCYKPHLKFYLESSYFFATKVERRWVKANTQKVLREETLPNDEITLPGAETKLLFLLFLSS